MLDQRDDWRALRDVGQRVCEKLLALPVPESVGKDESLSPPRLAAAVEKMLDVPSLGCFGPFDSGKSTLINGLIGRNLLPTGWRPVTSAVVFVNHVSRRPEGLDDCVFLLDEKFDCARRHDDAQIARALVASGGIDRLESGVRHTGAGARRDGGKQDEPAPAPYALVYVEDASVENIELIDTPGFGRSERDTALALSAMALCDIGILCHGPQSYCDTEYVSIFDSLLRELPVVADMDSPHALRNLLLPITHAGLQISDTELKRIRNSSAAVLREFCSHSADDPIIERAEKLGLDEIDVDTAIRERIIPYHPEAAGRCSYLADDLHPMLTQIFPAFRLGGVFHILSRAAEGLGALLAESDRKQPPVGDTEERGDAGCSEASACLSGLRTIVEQLGSTVTSRYPASLYATRRIQPAREGEKMADNTARKDLMDEVARAIASDDSIDEGQKSQILVQLARLKEEKVRVLVTGPAGAGKSSTINALFDAEHAKTSAGPDPETKDITKYEYKNLVLYDSPGLGDSPDNDKRHSRNITRMLREVDGKGDPVIDLVIVILDGGSRDLGTSFDLINHVIVPALDGDETRILVAINQADMAMKGRYWDGVNHRPEPELEKFLEEKGESVRKRIYESTKIKIDPVCYAAGDVDSKGRRYPYNLSKLLLGMLLKIKEEKRVVVARDVNPRPSNFSSNDKTADHNEQITLTFERSLAKSIVENVEKYRAIGEPFGRVGRAVGGAVGVAVGVFKGILGWLK